MIFNQQAAQNLLTHYGSDLEALQVCLFDKRTREDTVTGYRFDIDLIPTILAALKILQQGKSYFKPQQLHSGMSALEELPSHPAQALTELCITPYNHLGNETHWGCFLKSVKNKFLVNSISSDMQSKIQRAEDFHNALLPYLEQKTVSPDSMSCSVVH